MTAAAPLRLTHSKLVICEGVEERALLRQMIKEGRCPDVDISCIGTPGNGGGINGLREHLVSLVAVTGFTGIRDVAIFADHDNFPAMLQFIPKQIVLANADASVRGRYSAPQQEYQKASDSAVSITLIMAPGPAEAGCLETLLLKVVAKHHTAKLACVDSLIQCAGIGTGQGAWSKSKIDKARVRALIATVLKKNPALTLSWLWDEDPSIIPVSDTEFDHLSTALTSF